jgi:hypothetical protein
MILTCAGPACDGDALASQRAERGDQAAGVEGGVHSIAGARMIEGEIEQCFRRQARAGASERNARRRQFAKIVD